MEILAVFLPLAAFIIAGLLGGQIGDRACQIVTSVAVSVAALTSVVLFLTVIITPDMSDASYTTHLANWINSGNFKVDWSLRIDTLSIVMMCVINIVSACVHIYSIGYMSHDPAKGRFMAYLSLFTFAMLMLVTSNNLLQLFFGWEGVGLASYLLIGFWNYKPSANNAAQKAFVVNRIGDFGLALGTMAIFVLFGSIDFDVIFANVSQYAQKTMLFAGFEIHGLTLICLLLFMGAVGKSAQLGLHTWLPDAMEGPTPVSALIHAATMVTAGVFLIARFSPIFEYAPSALMVVTVFGALTAFVAATIGMTQYDIKRVIAYSTMSQLGYMFFALGVSAYSAAMFHLVTHAFFKALLFLGAGSVIHAMSDEQDMRRMGGIWNKIPITYTLMWIGSLALAGIPPFAGYFSKDIILESAWSDHSWFGTFAFWMGIAAAFMTAFYSWRLIFLTFHGQPRADHHVMDHVHESPFIMISPLIILATGALLSGYILYGGFVGSAFTHHKATNEALLNHNNDTPNPLSEEVTSDEDGPKTEHEETSDMGMNLWSRDYFWKGSLFVLNQNDTVETAHNAPLWVKYLPLVAGLLGILLSYLCYILKPDIPNVFTKLLGPLYKLAANKWFFDEIYNAVFVKNTFRLGRFFWLFGDKEFIDGLGPDGLSSVSRMLGAILNRFQSGYIYQYAFVMMIAVVGMISWLVFRLPEIGSLP